MDNLNDKNEIDITKIDWNVLNPKQWNQIESQMQKKHAIIKKEKRKNTQRISGTKVVIIRGNTYTIQATLYQRLKSIKSDGAREKLINTIISTHTPIPKL